MGNGWWGWVQNKWWTIPVTAPGEVAKFLGVKIDPFAWRHSDPTNAVKDWCARIDSYPLKPQQKVELVDKYALPRLNYELSGGGGSKKSNVANQRQEMVPPAWVHPYRTLLLPWHGRWYEFTSFGAEHQRPTCWAVPLTLWVGGRFCPFSGH